MRLDKYLKVSRIIKRRTLAKEVCDGGRVTIGGKVAKAGTEVKPGDRLHIDFGRRQLEVQINEIRETVRAAEAKELYTVIAETFKDTSLPELIDDPE